MKESIRSLSSAAGPTLFARRALGFTLIELSIVLIIIGIIISTVATISGTFMDSAERRESEAILDEAKEAVLNYAARHAQLPCPGDDGECGNGSSVGTIPAQAIGLGDGRDQYGIQLRYGVYRDGSDDKRADLTDDLYRNVGELCLAIRNAAETSDPSEGFHIDDGNNGERSVAFAVVTAGPSGSFSDTNSQDGDTIATSPEAANDGEEFDDLVTSVTFSQLSSELDCRSRLRDARMEFATSSTLRTWWEDNNNNDYEDEILVDGGLRDRSNNSNPEGYHWCIEERTEDLEQHLSFEANMEQSGNTEDVPVLTNGAICAEEDDDWAEGDFLAVTDAGNDFPDDESRLSFRVYVRDRAAGTDSGNVDDRDQGISGTFNVPLEADNTGNGGNAGNGSP